MSSESASSSSSASTGSETMTAGSLWKASLLSVHSLQQRLRQEGEEKKKISMACEMKRKQ